LREDVYCLRNIRTGHEHNNNNENNYYYYKTYFTGEILRVAQIVKQNNCKIIYPRNMVCFRYIIVNILHKGDNKDNNNNNNNSFTKTLCTFTYRTDFKKIRSEEISYVKFVARPLETINA